MTIFKTMKDKNNMDVHFSSKSNEWETPPEFFAKLNAEFNFDLDVAATDENHLCDTYFTINNSALDKNWSEYGKRAWMNPPYGRDMPKFVKYAYEQSQNGIIIVCLIPARTDTKVFYDYCRKGEIRFITGRLTFKNREFPTYDEDGELVDNPAPFPSCLVIFGGPNDGKVSWIKQ